MTSMEVMRLNAMPHREFIREVQGWYDESAAESWLSNDRMEAILGRLRGMTMWESMLETALEEVLCADTLEDAFAAAVIIVK